MLAHCLIADEMAEPKTKGAFTLPLGMQNNVWECTRLNDKISHSSRSSRRNHSLSSTSGSFKEAELQEVEPSHSSIREDL